MNPIRRRLVRATRILAWVSFFFSLGVFILCADLWWESRQWGRAWIGGPGPKDSDEKAKRLEEKLSAYKERADDLQTLVSLLLGLSTIYSLSLGVASYFGMSKTVEQAEKAATKLDEMSTAASQELERLQAEAKANVTGMGGQLDGMREKYDRDLNEIQRKTEQRSREEILNIQKEFPIFGHMSASIDRMMNELMRLLPRLDWREDIYLKVSEEEKQKILFYEKAVASFEFFDLRHARRTVSEIYHGLGNFYGLRFDHENKHSKAICEDLERARFYLNRAIGEDRSNIAALNDRALLAQTVESPPDLRQARELFQQSLAVDPGQQRARYNLAILAHQDGNYAESEALLSEALKQSRWQDAPFPARLADLHYNRACGRVRLAEAQSNAVEREKWLTKAMEDIGKISESRDLWDNTLEASLKKDIERGGDLYSLVGTEPYAQAIKKLLRNTNVG
jgi:tetratricopeptide (TPR) repeat protein